MHMKYLIMTGKTSLSVQGVSHDITLRHKNFFFFFVSDRFLFQQLNACRHDPRSCCL